MSHQMTSPETMDAIREHWTDGEAFYRVEPILLQHPCGEMILKWIEHQQRAGIPDQLSGELGAQPSEVYVQGSGFNFLADLAREIYTCTHRPGAHSFAKLGILDAENASAVATSLMRYCGIDYTDLGRYCATLLQRDREDIERIQEKQKYR